MINAKSIAGRLVGKFVANEDALIASWLQKYMRRLRLDFERIAMAKIAKAGYQGVLTFRVEQTGPRQITIRPSDPVLFKKLEFGEFDENGQMKTPPHSVLKEWKVFVRLNN